MSLVGGVLHIMNRRRLPEWLNDDENSKSPEKFSDIKQLNKKYKNEEEENEIIISSKIEQISIASSKNITGSKKSGTRKNNNKNENTKTEIQLTETTITNKWNQPQRILRSQSKTTADIKKEPEPKPSQYPFIEYKGNIKYLTDMIDIACACDEILAWVEQQQEDIVPIAFDMEWSFTFQTGPAKTALIQLCAEENHCFLFHIFHLTKLPNVLIALLEHKKVRLHGVNIKNDLRKLQRDFPGVKIERMIEQCIDLGTWCNIVCNTGGRWSLERLVLYICKLRINKDKKVRMSKWHVTPLNESQKIYAAIDVYISQVIYRDLEKRQIEKDKRTKEFAENFGEEALSAIQALGENFI